MHLVATYLTFFCITLKSNSESKAAGKKQRFIQWGEKLHVWNSVNNGSFHYSYDVNSTSSSQCKENSKWTMTHRMVRAACGYTLADDHRIVILPRETFGGAHLPPCRCEVEGISRLDKLKCCLNVSVLIIRNKQPGGRASHFSPFNWTHFTFSSSSSPESGQSVRIKSCLVTTRCVAVDAGDTREEYRWQAQSTQSCFDELLTPGCRRFSLCVDISASFA